MSKDCVGQPLLLTCERPLQAAVDIICYKENMSFLAKGELCSVSETQLRTGPVMVLWFENAEDMGYKIKCKTLNKKNKQKANDIKIRVIGMNKERPIFY